MNRCALEGELFAMPICYDRVTMSQLAQADADRAKVDEPEEIIRIKTRRNTTFAILISSTVAVGGLIFFTHTIQAQDKSINPSTAYASTATVPAKELTGGPWLNTFKNAPVTFASRKRKVTIVHFWTFGCINCKHNLAAYARCQKQFAKKEVQIIGVPTPEFSEEKVTSSVRQRVKELGITYPVLVDTSGQNWNRWNQRYWPTVYLIDKQGRIRYNWEGELEYDGNHGEAIMAHHVEELLKEPAMN